MLLVIKILIAFHFLYPGNLNPVPFPGHIPGDFNKTSIIVDGQRIFKDENTISLEKMVTPWLLFYTNQYRKEHGLDTLKYDDCLLKAATYHADYLFNESVATGQFKLGHVEDAASKWFKGKGPSERALTAGCQKYCGENALYFTLPSLSSTDFKNKEKLNAAAKKIARDMVYDQWHSSRGHRDNMLTKGYTSLGVSVAIGKNASDYSQLSQKELQQTAVNMVVFGIQVLAY